MKVTTLKEANEAWERMKAEEVMVTGLMPSGRAKRMRLPKTNYRKRVRELEELGFRVLVKDIKTPCVASAI
jgi:hypothetical protein